MDWSDLDSKIVSLDDTVSSAVSSGGNWRAIWDTIREIGGNFRVARYPTREEKDVAWNRFQEIVAKVKGQKAEADEQRAQSAVKAAELDTQITALQALAETTRTSRGQWKSVWDEIKRISAEFKNIRYPTKDAREQSWRRFQGIVDAVKAAQGEAQTERETFNRRSEQLKYEILACAKNAMPMNGIEGIALALSGMMFIEAAVTAVVNTLPGPPIDPYRQELEARSRALAEGRRLLGAHKMEMKKADKDEAWQALNTASELLERDWAAYKEAKNRQREEKQRKREEWEQRTRERITGMEEQIRKLDDAESRTEANLDKLRGMEYDARGDSYRERVRGWIDEAEEKLRSIRDRRSTVQGWISEAYSKLQR